MTQIAFETSSVPTVPSLYVSGHATSVVDGFTQPICTIQVESLSSAPAIIILRHNGNVARFVQIESGWW
jgi:hypothetical protein